MSTFNLIMEKIINFNNNAFSSNYVNDGIYGAYKIFFSILYNNYGNKYKTKFHFLEDVLNNFYFLNRTHEKNEFLNLFYKIQKVYHILNRFSYLYKYKRSKLVVETDLQLNNIKLGGANVVTIYYINNRYLFKIQDLLKLIYISLTNSYIYFSEPLSVKNPYNNLPFGKSILYYISYTLETKINIKFIKYEHLDVFLKFKQSSFNMTKFVNNYEYILREYAIQNHINNSTKQTLKNEILEIIKKFNNFLNSDKKKIHISEDFPDDILLKTFKPYLELKLLSDYSLVSKNRLYAKRALKIKLSEFQKFNPHFGKKIFKLKSIVKKCKFKQIISHAEFNVKCKKFHTNDIDNFMNNHLSYKYDQYTAYNENDDDNNDTDNDNINNNNNNNNNDDDNDNNDNNNNNNNDNDNDNNNNDNDNNNNDNVGENIFNLNIITQIIYNSQFNNEEQENEEQENIHESESELTSEDYDDNESTS